MAGGSRSMCCSNIQHVGIEYIAKFMEKSVDWWLSLSLQVRRKIVDGNLISASAPVNYTCEAGLLYFVNCMQQQVARGREDITYSFVFCLTSESSLD